VITDAFAVTLPGFAVGAVLMAFSNRNLPAEAARARWLKIAVYFLIVHIVLAVAWAGQTWVTALVALVLVAGSVELWNAWRLTPEPRPLRAWFVFVVVAVLALLSSWRLPPAAFAFLFLATATFDGFSQVVGQLAGRRRLAISVSPAKTVEGFGGGLVAAFVVALLTRGLLGGAGAWYIAGLTVLTALAALAGDLAASWVKRRAGIKDYSAALPGQGGFLDRFDSLLGVMAIVGTLLVPGGG
jgi:phosphatidate cytidylyltransferase